jgi:hypothetical protein
MKVEQFSGDQHFSDGSFGGYSGVPMEGIAGGSAYQEPQYTNGFVTSGPTYLTNDMFDPGMGGENGYTYFTGNEESEGGQEAT